MPENQSKGFLSFSDTLQAEAHVYNNELQTGASTAFRGVASDISSVGDHISNWADHAAKDEGELAGNQAGLDPEFRPRHDATIFGDAFDRAGLDVYKTNQRQGMIADLHDALDKHQADPVGLGKALNEKRSAWIEAALPETRSDLENDFQKTYFTFMREATRQQHTLADAQSKAAAETELSTRLREMQQRGYSLGLDETANETIASDLGALEKVTNRRGINGMPLIDAQAKSRLIEQARQTITTARIQGAFSRLDTLDAKEKFIQSLDDDWQKSEGFSKIFTLGEMTNVTSGLNSQLKAEYSQLNAQRKAVEQNVKQQATLIEKGYTPPEEVMAGISAQLATVKDPDLHASFDNLKKMIDWQSAARRAPPEQIEGYGEMLRDYARDKGATPALVSMIDMTDKLGKNMREALKTDPIGWADRVGMVKMQPIRADDVQNLTADIGTRIGHADAVADAYNLQTPQYLRPDEKRKLSATLSQGGDAGMALASAIAQGAGDRAPAVMAELSKDAPAVAMLGGHVAVMGDSQAARDAFAGLALSRDKDAKKAHADAKRNDVDAAARQVVGDAFSENSGAKGAAIVLANAMYQVRANRKNLDSFDSDTWKQGFREILGERTAPDGSAYGGPVQQASGVWNTRSIVLPPYLKQSGWHSAVDGLSEDDLKNSGVGLPNVSLDRIKSGTLMQAGDSRYYVNLGWDNERPQLVMDKGKPWVLDLNKLEPVIRRKRPDLIFGGH